MIYPRRTCPFKTFELLHTPGVSDELDGMADCTCDQFTLAFLRKYPGNEKLEPAALATLETIARMVKLETVQIEWGHGRVRRLISSSSIQTHTPHVEYVNAQWVLQKQRLRSELRGKGRVRPRLVLKKRPAAAAASPLRTKRRRGYGGAFRAYVSITTRGKQGRVDFQRAALEFQNEKEQNSEVYQEAVRQGLAATRRTRAGSTGFGAAPQENQTHAHAAGGQELASPKKHSQLFLGPFHPLVHVGGRRGRHKPAAPGSCFGQGEG